MSHIISTQVFDTPEFHAAVHALSPTVAVFDCDGTLWSGDAGSGFMLWSIQVGLISREAIDWISDRYRGYKHGLIDEATICGEMVQMYSGVRESEMRSAAHVYFEGQIAAHIFPEMQQLVSDLQSSGVDIWAVSSTNNWVIEAGVTRFNIPPNRVLAACVEIREGIITDNLLDVPTDEGKVRALARAGITHPDAVFGNSVHDAAMLSIARRAFPVNPSPELTQRSAEMGWTLYYPASIALK